MGKRFRNFLITFVAALGLIILIFSNQTTSIKAADYQTNDLLSGMSIQPKDYGTASNIDLTLNWDSHGNKLQDGDTWTIDLPDTLKVSSPGTTESIYDDDGNVIGNFVLNADNSITVNFTNVSDKDDFTGKIHIVDGIVPGKKSEIGDNNVVIGNMNDNMTVVTSTGDISKKGVIGKDANGDPIVTWTILVNRNEEDFPNLTVSDYITDSKLTYIEGSVNVYEAHWTSPGYYKKDTLVNPSDYTSFEESSNGFSVGLPKSDQFYAITLQTKINDPNQATDGSKFTNHADMTWYPSGPGNGGTINKDSADASVSGKTNSGNGNGSDVVGSVTLTKKDAIDHETLLEGAVYDLYEVGSDQPIKTGLVTDENGQITVNSLNKGNYYFKEITPPKGYQPNDNEILFTITGATTTVQVTAEDEPDSRLSQGSIVIAKIDAETGYRLAGAEFDLIDSEGNVFAHITTDMNGIGHLYNIPTGSYILRETKAPDGYLIGDDINVEIKDGHLTPALISVENEKEFGGDGDYSVNLQKFDESNSTVGVPNAEYTLYSEDGTPIETALTNEFGVLRVDNLTPGKYYFLETKAPDGFDLNPEKIHFEIKDNGVGIGTLDTSDPRTEGGNEGNTGDNNGNEGNTENPGSGTDNNGNEDNNNGGGIIVDPNKPGSGNNNNTDDNGLITNPINSGNTDNGSSNSNNTLPQTGEKTNLIVSLIGLIMLTGIFYNKRRHV